MNAGTLLGSVLDGKYQLQALVGKGGMGSVYRAEHLGTGRTVAVKVIAADLVHQPEYLERFRREAWAAGRLRHPNIVDLTDFGNAEAGGRPLAYLVMEFLEGWTLADVLKEGTDLPLPWVLDVVEQVCAALQAAHSQGIVHRDLKPENIWLEPDGRGGSRVKVLDFGLAKAPLREVPAAAPEQAGEAFRTQAMDPDATRRTPVRTPGESRLTEVGTILGTPAYMSPEQCRGAQVDARSDIYSLAVVLFEILAGRTPFRGSSAELVESHIQSRPPDLSALRKDLYPGIGLLVAAALQKDPADRPASARQFLELLRTYSETGRLGLAKTLHMLIDQPGRFIGPTWIHLAPSTLLLVPIDLALLGLAPRAAAALPWLLPGWFLVTFAAIALNAVALAAVAGRAQVRPLAVLPFSLAWSHPNAMGRNLRFRLRLLLPVLLLGLAFFGLGGGGRGGSAWLPSALLLVAGIGIGVRQFRDAPAFPLVAPILALEGLDAAAALARGHRILRPLNLRHQRNKLLQVLVPAGFYALVTALLMACILVPLNLLPGSPASRGFAVLLPLLLVLLALLLPVTQTAMTLRYLQLARLEDSSGADRGEAAASEASGAKEGIHGILSGRSGWR